MAQTVLIVEDDENVAPLEVALTNMQRPACPHSKERTRGGGFFAP